MFFRLDHPVWPDRPYSVVYGEKMGSFGSNHQDQPKASHATHVDPTVWNYRQDKCYHQMRNYSCE